MRRRRTALEWAGRLGYAAVDAGAFALDTLNSLRTWLVGGLAPSSGEFCVECRRWTYGIERGEPCDECDEIGYLGA